MILVSKSKIVGTTCLLDFYTKHLPFQIQSIWWNEGKKDTQKDKQT